MPTAPPALDASAPSIPLNVVQGDAYVYAPQHIAQVRSSHHLTPTLIGTLPLLSQQNVFLGPPALLLPEEVVLLMRRGAAHLIDDIASHTLTPSSSQVATFQSTRNSNIQAQRLRIHEAAVRAKEAKARQLEDSPKARAKREARAKARAAAGLAVEEEEEQGSLFGGAGGASVASTSTATTEQVLSDIQYAHVTPATSCSEAYTPSSHTYTNLSAARMADVWTFPRTLHERARCIVFEDLHARGYFMNNGLRFGGDFNCYPGDSLRYHSHFTATVLATPTTPVAAQELVASGRLGTAVKKAHLICGVEGAHAELDDERKPDEEGTQRAVHYYSLTWAGFGT